MLKQELEFKLEKKSLLLETISSQTYHEYSQNSIPIYEDSMFPIMLIDRAKKEHPEIIYPHYYMALKGMFGECDTLYDDYKCSFGYQFSLKISDGKSDSIYTLNLSDIKGNLTFYFKKILTTPNEFEKYGEMIGFYQKPFDEINEFMARFIGLMVAYIRVTKDSYNEEFIRYLEYHFLIYGYRDSEFFIEKYDSDNEKERESFYEEKRRIMKLRIEKFDYKKV